MQIIFAYSHVYTSASIVFLSGEGGEGKNISQANSFIFLTFPILHQPQEGSRFLANQPPALVLIDRNLMRLPIVTLGLRRADALMNAQFESKCCRSIVYRSNLLNVPQEEIDMESSIFVSAINSFYSAGLVVYRILVFYCFSYISVDCMICCFPSFS